MGFEMQSLVIFFAILSFATARAVPNSAPGLPSRILMQSSEVNHDGSFRYSYETDNGIRAHASGYLANVGFPNEVQRINGWYSYTAPDGTPISVTYTADENGFQAFGNHLPVAPEIPALIAKALAYNAAKAGVQDGKVSQARPLPILTTTPSSTRLGFATGVEL